MMTATIEIKKIVEAAIMAADHPMSIEQLKKVLEPEYVLATEELKEALKELGSDYQDRAIELKEVASGFRFQIRQELTPWLQKLWQEKPVKYSRALLETLALIIYRQPITRAEIEEIRGVAVSPGIIKTLTEREWVRVIGHKEVPGRPALYATTKTFLNDFNLKSLTELPPLAEIMDLEQMIDPFEQHIQVSVSEDVSVAEENNIDEQFSESAEEVTEEVL